MDRKWMSLLKLDAQEIDKQKDRQTETHTDTHRQTHTHAHCDSNAGPLHYACEI